MASGRKVIRKAGSYSPPSKVRQVGTGKKSAQLTFGYGPMPEVKRGRGAPSKYQDVVEEVAGKEMFIECESLSEIEGIRRCARRLGYRALYRGSRVWVMKG